MSRVRNTLAHVYSRLKRNKKTGCLEWTGKGKTYFGHVQVAHNGNGRIYIHRLIWEAENKKIVPDGLFVLHSCDNPSCAEIKHLRLGTHNDNMRDVAIRKRAIRYACPRGHKYTEENTITRTKRRKETLYKYKVCRTCEISRWKIKRKKQK